MPNPLSSRGFSDRDYAALVGTLAGEAAARGTLKDYQAIADVVANRAASGKFGKSIAGITMDPSQFSAWSPREKEAYRNAMAGFAASLNPQRAASFSPAMKERIELAQQAAVDVFDTAVARGITQGATFYDNPEVTAQLGTDAFHNRLNNQYGGVMINDHRFTGPGFNPNATFDPITYNGQLAAPPAAEAFFGDIGVPIGNVEFAGNLPDLSPAPEAGFSWDLSGATLPQDLSLDFAQPMGMGTFNGIFDAGFPAAAPMSMETFNGIQDQGFPAQAPAAPMDQGTFNDVFSQGFPNEQPQGFHAGFDAGPYGVTPDFNAPSLEQRNNEAFGIDRLENHALSLGNPSDMWDENIAASVMAEIGQPMAQSTPQMAAPMSMDTFNSIHNAGMQDLMSTGLPSLAAGSFSAPSLQTVSASSVPTAPTTTSSVPMGDVSPFSTTPQTTQSLPDFSSTTLPDTAPLPPSRPESFSLGPVSYGDLGLTIGGWSSPFDAAANAFGFNSGTLNSPLGRTLTGAGTGFLTGGIPGAVIGGVMGGTGWGDMMSNQLGNFLGSAWDHMTQGWDGYDFSTHGYGPGFNSRGERSHTGRDESGNATMGDGSYAERSGYNDNNPQGIY